MNEVKRDLTVLTDGVSFNPRVRLFLSGEASIGLYPSLFTLKAWNLSDQDYDHLRDTKELKVLSGNSCLAYGKICDLYRETVAKGTLTTVAFAHGLDLWETWVSLDVPAGSTMGETVCRILEEADIWPGSFTLSGPDPVFSRGQAFYGRAAQCIETVLTIAGARAYLAENGLCVAPADPIPPTLHLKRKDYADVPSFADRKRKLVLPTHMIGFRPGEEISAELVKGFSLPGLILKRHVEADTGNGPWMSELLMEIHYPLMRTPEGEGLTNDE